MAASRIAVATADSAAARVHSDKSMQGSVALAFDLKFREARTYRPERVGSQCCFAS